MKPQISILIPSLHKRAHFLKRITKQLYHQIQVFDAQGKVEIVVDLDNGVASIGEKRNKLLNNAKGTYCAFVDDDDRVSANYIGLLLKAITTEPDCCSLKGVVTFDGRRPQVFLHSIKYSNWFEKGGILYRCVNHLNCIRTEIAKEIGFKHISHGEDYDYSQRLHKSGLLKTEADIIPTLYYYDYRSRK